MIEAKLTKEQIAEIQRKYADGMTQKALAKEYGVSQALIQKRCGGPYRTYSHNYVKWSGIREYMQKNDVSTRRMSEETGITYPALYYILTGKHDPSKASIDKILNYTGLTYEQAFGGFKSE